MFLKSRLLKSRSVRHIGLAVFALVASFILQRSVYAVEKDLVGVLPLKTAVGMTTKISLQINQTNTVVAERIFSQDLGNNNFSWNGKLTGEESGYLSFAKVDGRIHGSVTRNGQQALQFSGPEDGIIISPAKAHKQCGGCRFENNLPRDPRRDAVPAMSWRNGDANLIDLLVVYPSAVRSEAGNTAVVEAAIATAVADSNLCYRNSLVPMQLRVVHMAEIVYTPTGTLNIDLDRLKDGSDGYMDNVHTLRDQYGADLVCLLTTDSDYGGLASTMQHPSLNFASSGFNVNVWDQLGAPNYTLAHEIGHNMGCLHNREDATWDTDYDYSAFCFGKRWLVGGEGYRTVMSYDSSPAAYNNRIPHFSNPLVDYEGVATGNTGTENNAKVLSISAPYVSNFRSSVVQGIVPSVFSMNLLEEQTGSFKVRLAVEPESVVQVDVTISGDSNIILSGPTSLAFDSLNWNIAQTVMVTSEADPNTNDGSATVMLSASSFTSSQVQVNDSDIGAHTVPGHQVGGVVSNELGMGMPGVSVSFSDGSGPIQTDENGTFIRELSDGWTGTITVSKDGYSFSPGTLNISSLNSNLVGQVFIGNRSSILFVDQDASGNGDGTNWANAYTDLGEALTSNNMFDEVWVAEGTYLPGEIRASFFLLPPNISVYGGFSGTETLRSQRDASSNVTILSGDIGVQGDLSDNCYHVVVPSDGSVLDGFLVRDGYANRNYSNDYRGKGAGLWADGIFFTANDCNFSNNVSYQGGSGVYLFESNATFSNCTFYQNSTISTGNGAGAYFEDSNVTISGSLFDSNDAHYFGGAIRSDDSNLSLSNTVFSHNRSLSSNGGGAMYLNQGSFMIQSCSFTSNSATHDGGAILMSSVAGSIIDSNFSDNLNSQWNGGGALKIESSSPIIRGCMFYQNRTQANNYGGAINLESSSPEIEDSFFMRNRSESNSAGAIYIDESSSPSLTNNHFSHNSASSWGGAIFAKNANFSVQGGSFVGNWANLGGGIATDGTVGSTFNGVRILGNEANATASQMADLRFLIQGQPDQPSSIA